MLFLFFFSPILWVSVSSLSWCICPSRPENPFSLETEAEEVGVIQSCLSIFILKVLFAFTLILVCFYFSLPSVSADSLNALGTMIAFPDTMLWGSGRKSGRSKMKNTMITWLRALGCLTLDFSSVVILGSWDQGPCWAPCLVWRLLKILSHHVHTLISRDAPS